MIGSTPVDKSIVSQWPKGAPPPPPADQQLMAWAGNVAVAVDKIEQKSKTVVIDPSPQSQDDGAAPAGRRTKGKDGVWRQSKSPVRPQSQDNRASSSSDAQIDWALGDRGTIEVAIVSYGAKMRYCHKIERRLEELGLIGNWSDLRNILVKDPATRVRHRNGRDPQTRETVFRQLNFAEVLIEHMNRALIEEESTFSVYKCNQGIHRADTCGRADESWSNSLKDWKGNRLLNARHFSFSEADSEDEVDALLGKIASWKIDAYDYEIETNPDSSDFYGYIGSQ